MFAPPVLSLECIHDIEEPALRKDSILMAESTEADTNIESWQSIEGFSLRIIPPGRLSCPKKEARVMDWFEGKGIKLGRPENIRSAYCQGQKLKVASQKCQLSKSSKLIR